MWVVFERRRSGRGWRHVFVLDQQHGVWVTLDPMASHTVLRVEQQRPGFDFPGWFRNEGYDLIEAADYPSNRGLIRFWWPATCVEQVKRLVGLRAWWVLTPGQLHRRLMRDLL